MANAIFKGDLAEVSFGKEVGVFVDTGDWTHTTKGTDTSVITLGSGHYLYRKIPDNILVGARLRVAGGTKYCLGGFFSNRRGGYITAKETKKATITFLTAFGAGQINSPGGGGTPSFFAV